MGIIKQSLWFLFLICINDCYTSASQTFEDQLDIEIPHFHNTAPALWDEKALQRVYFPPHKSKNSSTKPENNYIQPESLDHHTREECYQLDYPEETGQDLLETLTNENQNIIVTVWYENYQGSWAQNMINQNVQGSLWRCLCENHPNIIYTEADLSHYNINAYTYQDLATQLEINIEDLFNGPSIVVMNDQSGTQFRTEKEPDKLVKNVEEYIRTFEKDLYGVENPKCDFQNQILAENHYEYYLPNTELDMYLPSHNEVQTEAQISKHIDTRTSPRLSEPEKSFT
ncbi:unnamed protein product [Moneuplotes crassus]|uniref:Uncharacterized protein n=1 Tax=Euplotes crassus TaxID=5936 RepID=A0AAD1XQV1_EUPCR|nr:unnamed protein product [Moneuplotes crassus]